MLAEIDTGGPRVLHCDSRADCPTTPINVPISIGQQRRAKRAHSSCRSANSLADLDWNSATRLPGIPFGSLDDPESKGGSQNPKNPRREIDTHTDDEEQAKILSGRDVLAKSRASTQPPRRARGRNELTCLASGEVSRAVENVSKDECLSVTRNSREGARSTCDKVEQAESRLRDETERSRFAITANTSGRAIARRRSLQDHSWTRPLLRARQHPDTDPCDSIDRPGRTRAAGGTPLLSSHHSHSCSKVRSCEDNAEDTSEGFPGERLASDDDDDSRTDGNVGSSRCSERDERLEEEIQAEKISGKDPANRKRRGRACRVYSFLRLVVLLFLITFGQNGLFGWSVRKFSAGPVASCVSVLAIGTMIGAVSAAPVDLVGDAGNRAERSANLSHITGTSRKIQMYVKNRHLQILPDGTVNGSNDDTSDYTIFQRISVSRGQLRIRSVATCLYLCMDVCGLLYGAREHTDECVFNENLEQHNYNTYSSVRWSTKKKTMYLGLNRYGQPRRVQTKGEANLGRLSAYARVLTRAAPADRVEGLQRRMLGAEHNVRHRHHERTHRGQHGDVAQQQPTCPTLPMQEKDGRDKFRCRKRKKRKKRKRRCRQGERPGPQCQLPEESAVGARSEATGADASPETASNVGCTTPESKRSCEGAASEEACRRQALSVPAKKRKSRIDCDPTAAVVVVDRNFTRNGKNKAPTSNAKKPNVGGDSQSKKPDLTDGKKRKRKRPETTTQLRGSATSPTSSQKRYALGTTSSQASSSLTAPPASKVRASTASSSSSPSPPGASTAPSVKRVASSKSGRKKPPPSSSSLSPSPPPPQSPRNGVARPVGSRRVGKSFSDTAGSPGRPRSTPPVTSTTTPRSETAHRSPPSTTKVPETTTKPSFPPPSPTPTSPLSWQKSAEDFSESLSDSSLVDEEPSSSFIASEVVATATTESTTSTASSEVVAELTTLGLLDKDGEDGGSGTDDAILRATARFPFDRLAM